MSTVLILILTEHYKYIAIACQKDYVFDVAARFPTFIFISYLGIHATRLVYQLSSKIPEVYL